jgi:hypothetical protein
MWHINAVFNEPQKKEIAWCKIRRTGRPREKVVVSICSTPDPALWKSTFEKHSLVPPGYLILVWCILFKPCTKLTLQCNHRSGHLKTEYAESPSPAATPSWKLVSVSMRMKLLVAHEKLGQFPLLTVYVVPV